MIVVDASAVVDLLTGEPNASGIARLVRIEQTHAPELIGFEVLSAIRGQVRGSKLTPERAALLMRRCVDLQHGLELWPLSDPDAERAIELRDNVSAYDSCYVSLAENLKCPLVTADARLARASGHRAEIVLV